MAPVGADSRWGVGLQSDACLASRGLSCHPVPEPVLRSGPRGRPLSWPPALWSASLILPGCEPHPRHLPRPRGPVSPSVSDVQKDQDAALSAPDPGFLLGRPLPSVVSRTVAPKQVHILVPRRVAKVILWMGLRILKWEDKPRVRIGDVDGAWLPAWKMEEDPQAKGAGGCLWELETDSPRGASWGQQLC